MFVFIHNVCECVIIDYINNKVNIFNNIQSNIQNKLIRSSGLTDSWCKIPITPFIF